MDGPNYYFEGVEPSTDKHSRTPDHGDDVNRDRVSPQLLRTQSRRGNPSQMLDVLESSSDDERQVSEVTKEQSDHAVTEHGKESDDKTNRLCSARRSPKDITCSVCLSEYDNKAFLDKCFHMGDNKMGTGMQGSMSGIVDGGVMILGDAFCYFCILQWSEIVRTCPLCKSSFTSIIHSVKSMDNYQQHYLKNPDLSAPAKQSQNDGRFRYQTTLREGSQQRQQTRRRQQYVNESDTQGQRAQWQQAHLLAQRNRVEISQELRRTIYSSNLWVEGVTQEGRPRQREISPEFFRVNPACTHRLIPWLTRDLRVLLNDEESHVSFVLQIILSLITKVDLSSEEFCGHLRPFLFDKTEHFIHEFVSFARSPFDMNTYDGRVQYSWPGESREQARDTPTVFHSHTAGWQTPVPGPSGVSLLELCQEDWNIDSSVPQNEITSWSPRSSPGTTALNAPRVLGTVTISSSSSRSSWIEHSDSDEPSNGSSFFKGKRKGPNSERITVESNKESSKQKSRRRHRHSHKRRHKHKPRKYKREQSSKHKSRRHSNSVVGESTMPGPSGHASVDISPSHNLVEVIVVSDSSDSPFWSGACGKSGGGDLAAKGPASRSPPRSKSKEKNVLKCSHWSRSKSRDKGKHRSQSHSRYSESYWRRDRHSASERHGKWLFHDRSQAMNYFSVSQEVATESRRKSCDQSRSQSRHSESHSREARPLKRGSPWYRDNRDPLNSESDSSMTSSLKKEKCERGRSRSRSRSPGLSYRLSKRRSDFKAQAKKFERSRKSPRETSTERRRATSSSHSSVSFSHIPGSCSRRRLSREQSPILQVECFMRPYSSRSPSPNKVDAYPQSRRVSRLRSRPKSAYKVSTASSAPETKESMSCSDEDIKKEIKDLELRITADKKRLLRLLIKQERNKEGESVPRTEKDCQL